MKRKLICTLLVLSLMVLSIAPAALAQSLNGVLVMPNAGGSLNLRAWPGTQYASTGYVTDGESIIIYPDDSAEDSRGELWTKIKVIRTGKTGYVKNHYLSLSADGSLPEGPSIYVSADGGSLVVRSGPGTNFEPAGYVTQGEPITVLEKGTHWSKISVHRTGKVGFVKTYYIRNMPADAPVPKPENPYDLPVGNYDFASVMTKTAFGVVNLRAGAGEDFAPVGKLTRGVKLMVNAREGDWYQVTTLDGKSGWISKTYTAFGVRLRTNGEVNFRTGPGTNYSIIRELPEGTSILLHSISGKWGKVTVNGQDGYLHIRYIAAK